MAPGDTAQSAAGARLPTRIETRTLWERVHEYLREEILSDRLPPGTELQEVALAESLGVSRGPVREALGRLSAEGLVTIRPRTGAVVRSLSKDEFIECYQVREALETYAMRLAVPKLTREDVRSLDELTERMAKRAPDDVEGFFEANRAFHDRIVDLSGNRQLGTVYRQVARQIGRYQLRSVALRGNLERSIAEHREIVRAADDGDIDRAVQLLSDHIHVPQRRLEEAPLDELVHLGLAEPEAKEERLA
jgi:DNA-binding GntR family transcriptional regulator